MSIITRMRKQKAVYWPLATASPDDYGQPVYDTHVEIDCRWDDVVQEFIDSKGTIQASHSIVYTDRDIVLGGVLMLGELADITDEDNPKENENAWEIKRFDKIPNLRATEYLRMAYL